jgi:hypothetical protein
MHGGLIYRRFTDFHRMSEADARAAEIAMPAKRELSMRQLRHLLRLHHDAGERARLGLFGLERSRGRKLTDAERRLAPAQARALGEV